MISINGTIKYSASDPYDAGYGPSINVAIEPDDPTGLPKLKDGLIKVYEKCNTPGADFIATLQREQQVNCVYIESGQGRGYWKVTAPPTYDANAAPAQRATAAAVESKMGVPQLTYELMTIEDHESFARIAGEKISILSGLYQTALSSLGESGTPDIAQKMAVTAYIATERIFSHGINVTEPEELGF